MATDYILQTLQGRRDELARKLAARENAGPAYAENVEELKLAINALDAEIEARSVA